MSDAKVCLKPTRSDNAWGICGAPATLEYGYGVPGMRHYRCDAHPAPASFFTSCEPLDGQLALPFMSEMGDGQ